MDIIQAEWNQAVNAAAFGEAAVPVVGNVAAAPLKGAASLRADVIAQMQSRVRWVESVKWMASQGVTTWIEVGTGMVLGGLVKRIAEGVAVFPLGTPSDFEALP
jgi:[acyl-carrier-protein] S-malonyltransferase